MTLDVTGLPPSPEDVDAFIADAQPDAVERLADRLLASPAYGERWARHWLDVVGFAETNGFETNTPRDNAWPYRDYVIRALNDDIPYPAFILDQLAGDARGEDAATGFLVAGPYDTVKSPDPKLTAEQRANELPPARLGRGREPRRLELREDEAVQGVAAPRRVPDRRRLGPPEGLEGAERPRGTIGRHERAGQEEERCRKRDPHPLHDITCRSQVSIVRRGARVTSCARRTRSCSR
jgi:hypothetical protein